jgi:hypothetical protein
MFDLTANIVLEISGGNYEIELQVVQHIYTGAVAI